jgi:MFS family permease
VASLWGGLAAGFVSLTDVILAKTLHAPGWQVTLLATLGPTANLTSFFWAGRMQGRAKAGFFLAAGVLGRLPLLLILLLHGPGWLIGLSFLFAVSNALLATAISAVLQQRYEAPDRARHFGLAASASALAVVAAVQGAGLWLERDETAFPWIFALAAVSGLFSCFHLFRMEAGPGAARGPTDWLRPVLALGRTGTGLGVGTRAIPSEDQDPGPRIGGRKESGHRTAMMVGLGAAWGNLRVAGTVLRENPDFARFERSFMIYGFAFLSLLPVLPLYVVRELQMSYAQLSATKGIWSQIGLVVLSPVLGVALGRLRPLLFTGRTFLLLVFYPLCLLVSTVVWTGHRVAWVYLAFVVYSVAMTGVNLSWTLGSMHFARGRDASLFQGVHVALTGVRGLLAPSLGYAVYRFFGAGVAFGMSAALFTWAGWLMLRQDRGERFGGGPAGG